MLIPSIDLMGGKVVQLIQGKKKALEFDDSRPWIERFSKYPLVQLIDLDAAMGTGNNAALVQKIAASLPCQVGGGIRSAQIAKTVLDAGAQRMILGSALFRDGALNLQFAQTMAQQFGPDRLVFALDAFRGYVTIKGWKETTGVKPLEMIERFNALCSGFLYTHVDTEGSLLGFPMDVIRPLREATTRRLIAAGGIRSQSEIDELEALGVDAVVGMAIYQGLIPA